MKILDIILSEDRTATKYVIEYNDGLVGEATYINYPNKDIVCVPTQVACKMGCKFCHLSNDPSLVNRNLSQYEMEDLVNLVAAQHVNFRRPLLVSFMGSGEPTLNWENMCLAMQGLSDDYGKDTIRFAFATMLPRGAEKVLAFRIPDDVLYNGINVKAHLSLHFTDDETRWKYMPNASDIQTSLACLESYMSRTDCEAEVHYTLISGVNDFEKNIGELARLVHPSIGIKILHYSENPSLLAWASFRAGEFVKTLREMGYKAEFYKPNGLDIGSSCGQFDLTKYVKKGN